MASWNDPPKFGCIVAADNMHDWQWVRQRSRLGLWAWLAPAVLRCARCAQRPYAAPLGLGRRAS